DRQGFGGDGRMRRPRFRARPGGGIGIVMDFVVTGLNYLFGVPILGWGSHVGFVWLSLLVLIGLLIFTAFILLADRKIWAAVQARRGPNVVGPFGLLQSFAALLKFVFKEPIIPASSDKLVFLLAPLVTSILALS